MIFVTVGTHEQQFDRLIEYMDKWADTHEEEVIIQTGFCTYQPKNCSNQSMFSYFEMVQHIKSARIVITHGGPASFIMALQYGKTPIVVPRKKEYGEHVNNHQLHFCREFAVRQKNIIFAEEMSDLGMSIDRYDGLTNALSSQLHSNNTLFCEKLEDIVREMRSV